MAAMKQIAVVKNISEALVFEAVESAFAAAYKKDFGTKEQEVKVEILENTPELAKIYVLKEVVEDGDVRDENLEISETDAKKYDSEAELGDEIYILLLDMDELQHKVLNKLFFKNCKKQNGNHYSNGSKIEKENW